MIHVLVQVILTIGLLTIALVFGAVLVGVIMGIVRFLKKGGRKRR